MYLSVYNTQANKHKTFSLRILYVVRMSAGVNYVLPMTLATLWNMMALDSSTLFYQLLVVQMEGNPY